MTRPSVLLVRAALAALALSGGVAHAQGAPPGSGAAQSEVDQAVALAREARRLYDAGEFDQALQRFRAADRIAHSPVLTLHVARCERNLTHLVAARDAYRVIVAEKLAPDAPAPFVSARADAERELAALEPRIPRVSIQVPSAGESTRILLDGVVVPPASRAEPLWVDPGDHVLSRSDGGEAVERRFRAVEGAATLDVELPAAGAPATSPMTPSEAPAPRDDGGGEGTLVPGLIVLGVGVVALGVGIATGLVASSKTSEIEEGCKDNHCLASDAPKGDSANTFATVSTVTFIVAGAATAAGVVLLVTLGSDDEPTQVASRQRLELAPTPGGARGTWVF